MKNLKITLRLAISYILLLILVVIISWRLMAGLRSVEDSLVKMYRHPFTVSDAVKEVELGVVKIHREMKDVSTATTDEQIDNIIITLNNETDKIIV